MKKYLFTLVVTICVLYAGAQTTTVGGGSLPVVIGDAGNPNQYVSDYSPGGYIVLSSGSVTLANKATMEHGHKYFSNSGVYNSTTGSLDLFLGVAGTGNDTIAGTVAPNFFKANFSGTTLMAVTNTQGINIADSLFFNNGISTTVRSNHQLGAIRFAAGAAYTNSALGNAQYVNGYVSKIGSEDWVFPVGSQTTNELRTLSVFDLSGSSHLSSAYWSGDVGTNLDPTGGAHSRSAINPAGTPDQDLITAISYTGFWDWIPVSGNYSVTITVSIANLSAEFPDKESLRLVGWNTVTSQWDNLSSTIPSSDNIAATEITGYMPDMSIYSAVTVGSTGCIPFTISGKGNFSICSGDTLAMNYATTPIGKSTVYWQGLSDNTKGIGALIAFPANTGTTPVVYNYKAWVNGIGGCPFKDTLLTAVTVNPRPVVSVDQCAQTACTNSGYTVNFTTNIPATVNWRLKSPAAYMPLSGTGNIVRPALGALATLVYQVWASTPGTCSSDTTEVTVNVANTVDAGVDKSTCAAGIVTMAANSTGSWSVQSGNPGTASITTPTDPHTTITGFSAAGTYNFLWTSGTCTDVVAVVVTPTASDFGDLLVSGSPSWPIAKANVPTCAITSGVPAAWNGTSINSTSVWAGTGISTEGATINGGNLAANQDAFDDGLGLPVLSLNSGYTYPFAVTMNANKTGVTVYYRLWFDWNNDGNFTNDNDGNGNPATYSGSGVTASPVTVAVGVKPPNGASIDYKIRLAVSDAPIPDVYRINGAGYLLSIANGEIEDYTAPAIILPVTLIDFDAVKQGNNARLSWSTANEQQTKEFAVERSDASQTTWHTLGTVAAAGNSSTTRNYTLDDVKPLDGPNYYRLRTINLDGTYSVSRTRLLNFNIKATITVYPNPVKNIMTVAGASTGSRLQVVDAAGKVVLQQVAAGNTDQIVTTMLLPGMYLLKVIGTDGSISAIKVIKQ